MTPAMLIELLEALRSRVRRFSTLYGLGVALATLALTLLALASLDWMFRLSSMWRLLLLVGAASLVAWAIGRHLVAPLRSRLPVTDIAGRLERVFPQFEDRLRSAVGFIRSPTHDSAEMQRATIEQAVNLASTLPLRDVVDARPAWRALALGAAVAVAVGAGALALSPATRSIVAARVFNPFTKVQWPRAVQIAMLAPIAPRVPAGGRVEVRLRLARGDTPKVRPIVFYEMQDGAVRQEYLTRADDGRYTASLDARTEAATKGGAMKVWVVAGDDRTGVANVEVVPRLGVEALDARVAAPAYIGAAAPPAFSLATQPASGLVGSGVELTLKFTKAITGASDVRVLPLDESPTPAIAWTAIDERTVRGTMRLDRSLRFRVEATDRDGFPAAASAEYELIARPDQLPTAFIETPRRSEERTAESVVPLAGLFEDDVALNDAALIVARIAGQSRQMWTVPLIVAGNAAPSDGALTLTRLDDANGHARARVEHGWSLGALADANLKPGDVLEYGLSVTDTYELDGQRHPAVESGKLRITIISQEDLTNRVSDELRQVKEQVAQLKQRQDQTAGETESFKSDTAGKPALDQADASVASRLQQQQGGVASAGRAAADRLADLARAMEENKSPSTELREMARNVSDRLAQTSEGSMKDALKQMSAATQKGPTEAQRRDALDRTTETQRRASAELAEALRRLDEVGSLDTTIDALQKMLDAQRGLTEKTRELASGNAGKTPEQMSAQDRARMAALAAEQGKQAEATARAMERMGKTADQIAKSDPASAEAMKAAQKQGGRAQVAQSQKQASQQIGQNQQKNAKQSQQQAEAGLASMLNELRDAQKRKLAELQKKLAELQAQIDVLIRRQAGHNLDNLTLRGGEALTGRAELVAELRAKGARKPTDPKPEPGRLLAGQGQSERNARDIAKKAADVPDGAEPASRLTRAATLMERAAVNLKDGKLAEAYEPPQLDALATLEEAKRIIDEQKAKADDEAAGQQREAIRQAYVRIRGEQQKLADETQRLDAARDPQGVLARADGVRLGQLPTEQQKLADDVATVGENLVALKSSVYVWANKEIAGAMADVKAGLAAAKTGAPTQARHAQILGDLTAMIENLKVDPIERKFESAAGGAGAGKPGAGEKPLPAEAELRLTRSLQEGVNTSTKAAADAKDMADAARAEALVALGRRQSQLRALLAELMSKAGGEEGGIGPEAKDLRPLPEEATLAEIDDRELEAELLGGKPGGKAGEIDVRRIGDRMARSRQRLEDERDAGRVTQVIQRRILDDFDLLIQAARQQQGKPGGEGKPGPQDVAQEPKPDDSQAQNEGKNSAAEPVGTEPAADSKGVGPNGSQANAGKDIKETAEEWGRISPRLRGPVLESRDDTIVERYRRLIEDYSQAVSTEATGGAPAKGGQP